MRALLHDQFDVRLSSLSLWRAILANNKGTFKLVQDTTTQSRPHPSKTLKILTFLLINMLTEVNDMFPTLIIISNNKFMIECCPVEYKSHSVFSCIVALFKTGS